MADAADESMRRKELRRKIAVWVNDLQKLKEAANKAEEKAIQAKELFAETPSTSRMVTANFLLSQNANQEFRLAQWDYGQCCDAINGAKALLDNVEVYFD